MKTVRLSERLKEDILEAAEKKIKNTTPDKDYPVDGYKVLDEHGVIDKVNRTQHAFIDIWGYQMKVDEIDQVEIQSEISTIDNDGDEDKHTKTYRLSCSPIDVPAFMSDYGTFKLKVPPTDSTFVECITVENYNSDLRRKLYDRKAKLEEVMSRFSTLNQLLKAAPYMKDLVPQDKLTKMYEKDDRTARRQELAEVADNELQDLRETLLEDALLGDD